MAQNGDVKTSGKVIHHSADEPKKFDKKLILSRMPEVGHFDSEGYTVFPKYYDDDIDYSE